MKGTVIGIIVAILSGVIILLAIYISVYWSDKFQYVDRRI